MVVGEDLAVGGQHDAGAGRLLGLVAEVGVDVDQGGRDLGRDPAHVGRGAGAGGRGALVCGGVGVEAGPGGVEPRRGPAGKRGGDGGGGPKPRRAPWWQRRDGIVIEVTLSCPARLPFSRLRFSNLMLDA